VSDPDVARHIIANVPILEMRQYLTDLYVAKARKAKKIDLTTLTMETFLNAYYENLPRWLADGKEIRVLCLAPNACATIVRGRQEQHPLDKKILLQHERLATLCKNLKNKKDDGSLISVQGSLEVRVYDGMPYHAYFRADNEIILGFYFAHVTGLHSECLYLQKSQSTSSVLFERVKNEFDYNWKESARRPMFSVCSIIDSELRFDESALSQTFRTSCPVLGTRTDD